MTDTTSRMNALALAALQMNKAADISKRKGNAGQADLERHTGEILKEIFQELQAGFKSSGQGKINVR